MIILIDSGNSRLKAGWLDQTSAAAGREPHAVAFDNWDIKALGNWLSTLPQTPQRAVGVNVAGQQRGQFLVYVVIVAVTIGSLVRIIREFGQQIVKFAQAGVVIIVARRFIHVGCGVFGGRRPGRFGW